MAGESRRNTCHAESVMLELVVFLCGAAVMVLEIVGARILAPYLGASIVVWTGLIGVILASLSLGYWWGGRLADKNPTPRRLAAIILGAAACVAVVAMSKALVLDILRSATSSLHVAVLAANVALFAPASLLLGMVSPYAVRLKLTALADAGRTAGTLYALSTLGSIVGTFLAGFVLIAFLGTGPILMAVAGTLALAALLCSRERRVGALTSLAVFTLLGFWLHAQAGYLAAQGFHDLDTDYNRVLVYESREEATGRPILAMVTNPRHMHSAIYPDEPDALVFDYTRFFTLAGETAPAGGQVLLLGGGAYSFPRYVAARYPGLGLTVVELDPGMTAIARNFFHLPENPPFAVVHEDARTFLNRDPGPGGAGGPYDAILVDIFDSHYAVPFHVCTLEAVTRMRTLLAPDGLAVMNLIGTLKGPKGRFVRAVAHTFAAVFPHVGLYPLGDPGHEEKLQNVMLVASARPLPEPGSVADPELARWLAGRRSAPLPEEAEVLTDTYAPVERYTLALW